MQFSCYNYFEGTLQNQMLANQRLNIKSRGGQKHTHTLGNTLKNLEKTQETQNPRSGAQNTLARGNRKKALVKTGMDTGIIYK